MKNVSELCYNNVDGYSDKAHQVSVSPAELARYVKYIFWH